MSPVNSPKFTSSFLNPAYIAFVEKRGYVLERVDQFDLLKALGWDGTVSFDYQAFITTESEVFRKKKWRKLGYLSRIY